MRFRAIGRAVRVWALREPARYGLLYGTPVPGYAAPPEQTVAAGTRVIVALVEVLERAWVAGRLDPPGSTAAPTSLAPSFAAIRDEFGLTLPDDLLARGVFAWAALFGAVSFEVFDQYGRDTFADPAALFDHHLDVLAESLGLRRREWLWSLGEADAYVEKPNSGSRQRRRARPEPRRSTPHSRPRLLLRPAARLAVR